MEVRCLARTLQCSWPTCTWHKIIELILLWHCLGRGGLLWNINSWGASCSVAPILSPLLCKSCTWSVSDDVMFPSLFWWGDHSSCNHLVLSQDFAITRTWYSVLRDTTKPAYHSKNLWQQVVLSWPNASLPSTAWCCNFLSSIAQEHLPWSIFHAALSLFFLWTNHDTSEPLTYSVLPSLVHTGKCVHALGICSVWSGQLDVNAWYLWFTRHDLMMNSSFSL